MTCTVLLSVPINTTSSSTTRLTGVWQVETLVEAHAPMGRQFRCWKLVNYSRLWQEMVEVTMLLALICPNMYYAHIVNIPMKVIDEYAKAFVECLPLGRYEQRLQQLRLYKPIP
ncbi:hypothetical protein GGI20_005197 [Coemansia sp. BCRC 34301]|nr:hypothetical protein GGI20_005197 [Coemansia sp. BCRC 34301]